MFSVASPVLLIVYVNVCMLPTFTIPKSWLSGVTLITGPDTAAARAATLPDRDTWAAAANPGATASAKSPRATVRYSFRIA